MADSSPDRWQEIERLYHAALDCDVAGREAFLTEACGDDEELRHEVRSLLNYESAAEGFLEQPALVEVAQAVARDARPILTGQQIAGYDVIELVGAGGMGEVYRARDRRLRRDVALKVIDQAIAADPEYRRRVEHEAQSASALNHPNIVTIYSVGEDDEVAFITMELVQGQTLRQLMATPLPLRTVLDISVQLASALSAAHTHGIVHRDLKPENIMVTPDGLVKVLDFGIARRDDMPSDPWTTAGTLAYMSPEQVRGEPVGPPSDQFAVGSILYEMVTGRHAFHRDSTAETLAAIVDAEPRPIATLNADVPASLRQVVSRCLSKPPGARYASAGDLETALRRVREEVTRWPSRRQLLWLGAGAAAATVAGVTTWTWWPLPSLAVLPFANTAKNEGAAYLCLGLTRSLIDRIKHLPVTVKSFSLVSNFVGSSVTPRTIGRQLGVEKIVVGDVVADGGRLLVTAELIDVASGTSLAKKHYDRDTASIFKLWDELATAIVDDGLHLRLTRDERRELLSRPTDSAEAFDLFLQGRRFQMGTTEDDYLAARALLERAVDTDPRFAEAWVSLAGTYWTSVLDNFTPPAEGWLQVDRCLTQATALNPRLPDLRFGRAMTAFFSEWNWAAADREWRVAQSAPDRDIQPELLTTHALALWAIGDPRGALRLVQRARVVDPLSPLFMLHEASYLLQTAQFEEAAARCLSVISTHPEQYAAYFMLAEIRRAQRRFDDAIEARRKAHALRGDSDDELDTALADAVGETGYAQIETVTVRRLELRTLLRRRRTGYASPLDFARAHAQLGEVEPAFDFLAQARAERSPGLVFLNVDRAWDSIRTDRRFGSTVRQVGLPS